MEPVPLVRLLNAIAVLRWINASELVLLQRDVFGGSCLVCQSLFSAEENSKDMGFCFRVNERAWWNSSLNCRVHIQLHSLPYGGALDVNI